MNEKKNHRETGIQTWNFNKRFAIESSHARRERAFTLIELVALLCVITICALMVLPSLARTRTNSPMTQCQNNLRQLAAAWTMYSADNKGWLVSAYPIYAGFTASWCGGNAATGGGSSSYTYGGAEPAGITNGLLWPYIKSLSAYKCPSDKRISLPGNPFPGQPILRTVSMNSYMAGRNYGANTSWNIFSGGSQDPNAPVFLKENEISQPSNIWVILDEDPQSINDGMFLVDMGGAGRGFGDLPSRSHSNGYGINFADGHTEYIRLTESNSLNWVVGGPAINTDWRRLTNITTARSN
jgi:hypothetical protein